MLSHLSHKRFNLLPKKLKRRFSSIQGYGNGGSFVLSAIMVANVSVWGFWHYAEERRRSFEAKFERLCRRHLTVSYDGVVRNGRIWTLLTSVFSHRDGWHLFGNMFTLYNFGPAVLASLGRIQFLSIYMGGGVLGSVAHILYCKYTEQNERTKYGRYYSNKINTLTPALGASGAVCSILAYSICLNPRGTIMIFPVPLPIPTFVFGLGYVANEFRLMSMGGTNEGHAAHLTGIAFGLGAFLLVRGRHRFTSGRFRR